MTPPGDGEDVAIDQKDTSDIEDRDDAKNTTRLTQGRQGPYPTEEICQEEGEEGNLEGEHGNENAQAEVEDEDMASWTGQPSIKGSTESMRMALLTFSLIGLQ
jgi:solute carrier family 45 protein 1/2/4